MSFEERIRAALCSLRCTAHESTLEHVMNLVTVCETCGLIYAYPDGDTRFDCPLCAMSVVAEANGALHEFIGTAADVLREV